MIGAEPASADEAAEAAKAAKEADDGEKESLIHKSLRDAMSSAEGAVKQAVVKSKVDEWMPLLLIIGVIYIFGKGRR